MAAFLVGNSALPLCSPVKAAAVNPGKNKAAAKPANPMKYLCIARSILLPPWCPVSMVASGWPAKIR